MRARLISIESGDAAFAVDGEGLIISWNEAAERLLGHSASDTLGRACSEILRGQDIFGNLYCQTDCNLCRMVRDGRPVSPFELDVRKASGEILRVSVSIVNVAVEDPERRVLIHIVRESRRVRARGGSQSEELTLMVSDIEGSTELMGRVGEEGALRLLHVHNLLLRECLPAYGGREIQHTGDGMIAAFESSASAVHCAVAVQQDCARRNHRSLDGKLGIRIGLHAGLVRHEESRLFGGAVIAAVRVCAAAQAGQILITDKLAGSFDTNSFFLIDLGIVPLKGFESPFRLSEVDWRRSGEE
jgi:PAS domain S-box-containing protein